MSERPWIDFVCACGGQFRSSLRFVTCPQCGQVTEVPAATQEAPEGGEVE